MFPKGYRHLTIYIEYSMQQYLGLFSIMFFIIHLLNISFTTFLI